MAALTFEVSHFPHRAKRLLGGAAALISVFAILAIMAAPAGATNVIKWGSKQQIDPPEQPVPAHGLLVSCPTKHLCVAVDNSGRVLVSTDPHPLKKGVRPSRWFKANESDTMGSTPVGLGAVSCLPTLCVAADHLGRIVFSTHPSSKTAKWGGPTAIDANGISSISCPSSSLCIAADNAGQIVSSTNPTGGAGQWHAATVDAGQILSVLSCPTTTFCVALDRKGNSVSSSNPTGGQSAWTLHTGVDPSTGLFDVNGLSCPSKSLCAADDESGNGGNIFTTTNPASGAKWKIQFHDGGFHTPFGMSCPSPTLCIAGDDNGNAFTSTNPTGGKSAWSVSTSKVDPRYGINNISCTATALCLTGDNGGFVVAGQLPPPNTRITGASIRKSTHKATFSFKASGLVDGFQCALRKKGAKPRFSGCSSPKTYKNLSHGSYTFLVKAFNLAGNDTTPASQGFTL